MDDIVERMRCRTLMQYRGHGDVRDLPDEDCNEAADEIERLRAEIARLRGDLKVQANAVRILDQCRDTEVSHLRKTHQQAEIAAKTLDSEREANSLLTAENERLREALKEIEWQNAPGSEWRRDRARAAVAEQEKTNG